MFYGIYDLNGERHCGFYDYGTTWYAETFSPDADVKLIIDLTVHGKTYADRKNDVIDKAHDYLSLYTEYGVSMSWGECATWSEYFKEQGKRYGLLTEFRENAIC